MVSGTLEGDKARHPGIDAGRHPFRSHDGHILSSVRLGMAGDRRILFFGAPGLPIELSAGWLYGLSRSGQVAGLETRGLFGEAWRSVGDVSPQAQIRDAVLLMHDLNWPQAHVVGVCGGAALALLFAAARPQALQSLTLWFGDYELGIHAPKTEHQSNLKSLMGMVACRQVAPGDILDMLLGVMSQQSPPDIAPFLLYPFSDAGLFDQYCRMNHAVMSIDCAVLAARVTAPCLVGYSPEDQTAHPQGSLFVAQTIGAEVASVGNVAHLCAIQGREPDIARVRAFQTLHQNAPSAAARVSPASPTSP